MVRIFFQQSYCLEKGRSNIKRTISQAFSYLELCKILVVLHVSIYEGCCDDEMQEMMWI
jgi:hypothetical protein